MRQKTTGLRAGWPRTSRPTSTRTRVRKRDRRAEPREGVAVAGGLLPVADSPRLGARRLPRRVALPLLRAFVRGRPHLLRGSRRAWHDRREGTATRVGADGALDGRTPRAHRRDPEAAAVPARRPAPARASSGTRHTGRGGSGVARSPRRALAGGARGRP